MPRIPPVAALLLLLAGTAILFVGGGSRFGIGLALKAIEGELGSGRTLLGVAVFLFQLVSAVAMFWSGRLADRADPGAVLLLGLVVGGAGIGLLAWITAPWQLVVLYGLVFALGNGLASLIPVGVLITRQFPDRAGLAGSIALAGMASGQLVMIMAATSVLVGSGWRVMFMWLGVAHVILVPLLLLAAVRGRGRASQAVSGGNPGAAVASSTGLSVGEAARTPRFWLLLAIYALCGLEDFFVTTHIVAFAQDRGADTYFAGNLLAFMGLTGLVGVLAAGAAADRIGPVMATLICFVVRAAIFALVLFDQRTPTVAVFALLFGATLLVTAPLTVIFVRDAFGVRHLGALTGLITMVHHIAGGLGALIGATWFDTRGSYDASLVLMLASSVLAALATLGLVSRTRTTA